MAEASGEKARLLLILGRPGPCMDPNGEQETWLRGTEMGKGVVVFRAKRELALEGLPALS